MRSGCSGNAGAAGGGGFLSGREVVSAGASVLMGGRRGEAASTR